MFKAIRLWREKSLANSFALQVSSIVLISVFSISLVSLTLIYWIEEHAFQAQLERTINAAVDRLEHPLSIVETVLTDLSNSAMFTNALLDSGGRSAYLSPFLSSYSFPVPANNGIALCDINGAFLAGSKNLSACDGESAHFQAVMADGKNRQNLQQQPDGRWILTIYRGVRAVYSGTIEGVAVAQIEIDDLLQRVQSDLNLEFLQLQEKAGARDTGSPSGFFPSSPLVSRAAPVFRKATEAVPVELVIRATPHQYSRTLLTLLLGYGLVTVFLLALILFWAKSRSRNLVAPLLELRDRAQEIARTGDLDLALVQNDTNEVGQLAQSLDQMVKTIAQSKQLQQESEERFRLIFEKSGEAILFSWPDGRIELANPVAMKLFGLDQDEFCLLTRSSVMDTSDPRLLPALEERRRTGVFHGELRCCRKNGEVFPVEVVSSIFVDRNGEERTSSFFRDISERKAAEEALNYGLKEIRLREKALSAVSQGVLITGPDRLTTFVNAGFVQITGYTESDILGQPCNILQGEGSSPEAISRIRQSLKNNEPFHGEILNYRKDGSPFWNELSITPVFDEAGTLSQFVGVQRDVTERKNTLNALRASQVLISTVFNSLDEIIVVLNKSGLIVAVNDAWRDFALDNAAPDSTCQGLGINYVAVCNAAQGACSSESGEAKAGILAVLQRKTELFELEYPCHSPSEERWFKMRALPLRSDEGGALVIHKNITAQKQFERETIESTRHITLLSRHLVAVQEDARRRLAAELHDLTSPSLAAIGINFEVAEMALREGNLAELAVRIEDNNALIQETAENIRDICTDLRPPALDYAGLPAACEAYIERFSKRFGIKSNLKIESQSGVRLAPEIESLLFRIFQEALTNVAKHAAARTVNVCLHIADYPLMLEISDDGVGFDLMKLGAEAGLGVLNMKGMSDFAGGLFEIQSTPGKGTQICVRIFSPGAAS